MRRITLALTLLSLVSVVAPAAARAAASWQLEQPPPPPPPPGVTALNVPVGLGTVGDIKFWAPNRGLLITGGNPPAIAAGLWAYNGVSWHLLSTVCGSGHGRIAWAGPDEFWTISDPAPNSTEAGQIGVTLCHVQNGAVVASYATPTGSSDPYTTMFAAACNGPTDCWFAGRDANPPLTGSFHLHWDGANLTDTLAPQDHQIDGLAAVNGQFFESASIQSGDQPQPSEDPPVLLHRIVEAVTPDQQFADEPFTAATAMSPTADPEGFLTLGTDGSDLWAVGGEVPVGASQQMPMAARFIDGNFEQLNIQTSSPSTIPAGDAFLGVAPVSGGGGAWVTAGTNQADAQSNLPRANVALIGNDGATNVYTVPSSGSSVAPKGSAAGPIACPAATDCWMATREGWLFHYTDGTTHPKDTDPNFFGVIDRRPPDAGTSTFYPDTSPLDNSLANQVTVTVTPPSNPTPPPQRKPVKVVTHEHERLRGMTLVLSFQLALRARMSLIGLRHGRRVASSGTHLFRPGHHTLSMRLDRHRWPTSLKLNVTPVKGSTRGSAADAGLGGVGAALSW